MDKSLTRRIEGGVKQQPSSETEGLVLPPLMAKDDLAVREQANSRKIAYMRLEAWWCRCCGRSGRSFVLSDRSLVPGRRRRQDLNIQH